jgi:hypothetical protein
MSKTATYRLVEDRLGKDLRRHVVALWKRGESWNAIARDLHGRTGVAVTSETIRVWFSDLKRVALVASVDRHGLRRTRHHHHPIALPPRWRGPSWPSFSGTTAPGGAGDPN